MSTSLHEYAEQMKMDLCDQAEHAGFSCSIFNIFNDCDTPVDMAYRVLTTYPLDSHPYKIFRDTLECDYLREIYPTEYVAVFNRWCPYPAPRQSALLSEWHVTDKLIERCSFIPRWRAELNPNYVQWVVGGILHTSDNKQVFLRCLKDGTLQGKITLIQGHASFNPTNEVNYMLYNNGDHRDRHESYDYREFELYLFDEFKREALEETNAKNIFGHRGKIDSFLIAPEMEIINKLDYFHIGIVFNADCDWPSTQLHAAEPDKNELVIVEDNYSLRKEFLNNHWDEVDRWVKVTIRKF